MRFWLMELLAWFVENVERLAPLLGLEKEARGLSCEAKRQLRRAVTKFKDLCVLYAVHRLFAIGFSIKQNRRTHTPCSSHRGFCFKQERVSEYRQLVRAAFRGFHRGDFKTRVARLRDALDNIELYIDRIFKRARRRFVPGRFTPIAPPPRSFVCSLASYAVCAIDSS